MSFAGGKRRGNKVRKGVQFTVMVVGQSPCCPIFRFHRWLTAGISVIQVLLVLGAQPS